MAQLTKPAHRLCIAALATLALAGFTRAQSQVRTLPFTILPAGGITVADAGIYTGEQRVSVAFAAAGSVFVLYDPSLHTQMYPAGVSQATGLATWPSSQPTTADQLIVTCDNQASMVTNTPGTFSFTKAATLSAAWHGATGLQSRRAGNKNYLVGIAAGGNAILLMAQQDGGPVLVGVTIGVNQVKQACLLDWDHDGAIEVVAMTPSALLPFELTGTPLPAIPIPGGAGLGIVALSDPTGDRLAGVYQDATGYHFAVLDGIAIDPPIDLDTSLINVPNGQPLLFGGLRSAQIGPDQFGDVLVYQQSTDILLLVEREGTTTTTQHAFAITPPSANPSANSCVPIWRDLNYDQKPDSVLLRNVPKEVKVIDKLTGDTYAVAPIEVLDGNTDQNYNPATRVLSLNMLPSFLTASTPLEVRVTVWHDGAPLGTGLAKTWTGFFPGMSPSNTVAQVQIPTGIMQTTDLAWPGGDEVWLDVQRFTSSIQVGPTASLPMTVKNSATLSNEALLAYLATAIGYGEPMPNVYVRPTRIGGILPRGATPPPR